MDFAVWSKIALICILGAISPGPSLAIIIRNTTSGGRHQGVMAAIGHGIGVGIYALVAVTGLVLILRAEPALFSIINWAGVGFLVWVGIQLLRASFQTGRIEDEAHKPRGSLGFAEGFTVAFLNPKIAAFFLAVFSQFVSPDLTWVDRGIMVLTAGIIDTVWYVVVALVLTGSGMVNWLRRREGLVNRIIGSLLLLAAVGLLFRTLYSSY